MLRLREVKVLLPDPLCRLWDFFAPVGFSGRSLSSRLFVSLCTKNNIRFTFSLESYIIRSSNICST